METSGFDSSAEEDMQADYDFRKLRGVERGKFAERYRTENVTVRILQKDGTIVEGSLSEMRKKFGPLEVSADVTDRGQITFIAVPNELVPQVQALIARQHTE